MILQVFLCVIFQRCRSAAVLIYYLHMQHLVSTERKPWLRTAIYTFMTLSVTVIVSLLMLVVLGYQFNQKDGRLEQGGLLQFYSIPTGAQVTLNEIGLGSLTNTKSTVDAGSHFVLYNKQDYRAWQKSIAVTPGQVAWLTYARLIPQTITPESLQTYSTLSGALASSDRRYMLLQQAAELPKFTLVDIQGDTPKYSTLTLPTASYTAPATGKKQSFVLDSWSGDSQAVLIRHTYDANKIEWILLDREKPERSINLSTTYVIAPSRVEFAGGNHSLLFVQVGDIVQRINLDEQTLSRPLVTRISDFTIFDDKTIAYVTKADAKSQRTVGYATVSIPEPQTVETYPADKKPLFVALSQYFNQTYFGIVHGNDMTVLKGELPTPNRVGSLKKFANNTVPQGVTNLEVRGSGRFFMVMLPGGYATYDIELQKYDETIWKYTSKTLRPSLQWLDNYMLWSDYGGTLRFYEFDGANQQDIMPAAEGFAASLSPNDKYIYNIAKTEDGYVLQRGLLILQ